MTMTVQTNLYSIEELSDKAYNRACQNELLLIEKENYISKQVRALCQEELNSAGYKCVEMIFNDQFMLTNVTTTLKDTQINCDKALQRLGIKYDKDCYISISGAICSITYGAVQSLDIIFYDFTDKFLRKIIEIDLLLLLEVIAYKARILVAECKTYKSIATHANARNALYLSSGQEYDLKITSTTTTTHFQ